jgi:endonuclease/exonuclease/phosphatase (EEP) superfamily protein YafD
MRWKLLPSLDDSRFSLLVFGVAARIRLTRALVVGLAVAAGCTPTVNLPDPSSPRFLGAYASYPGDTSAAPLRIVAFNVKLGRRIDRAIEVLQSDSLRGADVITLEEMTDVAADSIARGLQLNYAYYPSFIHPTDHTYFGPAVLSRWPIVRSWKLFLPHRSRTRGQIRTATAADVVIRGDTTRVYAVHLETAAGASDLTQADQARAVIADAAGFDGPVIIGGDFNSYGVGVVFTRAGYRWLTKYLERTISYFAWDHIFVRGLEPLRSDYSSAGVVRDVRGASDHHPVWAVVVPAVEQRDDRAKAGTEARPRAPKSP